MLHASVTSLYAALLAAVYFALFSGVGAARGKAKRSLGVGDDPDLIVADRRHMNFVENVPLALLLILMVEINGAPSTWTHTLGGALLVGRIVHPFGLSLATMNRPARIIGAGLTALVMVAAIVTLLWQHFRG